MKQHVSNGFSVSALVSAIVIATALPHAAVADSPHCPPGLAKKGDCAPPGKAKQPHGRFSRGEVIGDYRVIQHERYDLPSPGHGHIYVEAGGDIYLIAEATRRVIEALTPSGTTTR